MSLYDNALKEPAPLFPASGDEAARLAQMKMLLANAGVAPQSTTGKAPLPVASRYPQIAAPTALANLDLFGRNAEQGNVFQRMAATPYGPPPGAGAPSLLPPAHFASDSGAGTPGSENLQQVAKGYNDKLAADQDKVSDSNYNKILEALAAAGVAIREAGKVSGTPSEQKDKNEFSVPGGKVTGDLEDPPDVPKGYFNRVRGHESSGQRGIVNPESKTAGWFQFAPGTVFDLVRNTPGLKDKINDNWRTDDRQQLELMKAYTARSIAALKPYIGDRPPTMGELYLFHWQGHSAGPKLMENLDTPLYDTLVKNFGQGYADQVLAQNRTLNKAITPRTIINAFNKSWGASE